VLGVDASEGLLPSRLVVAVATSRFPHFRGELRLLLRRRDRGTWSQFAVRSCGARDALSLVVGRLAATPPAVCLLVNETVGPSGVWRGFAAHQVAVALVGLASLARRDLRRPAMALAAATDVADIVSAAIEARSRARVDADLSDGIVFSSAGLGSALLGMRLA